MSDAIRRSVSPSARNKWGYGGNRKGERGTTTALYAVACQGVVRIGLSLDVTTRLKTLQSGCPFKLTLIDCQQVPKAAAADIERVAMLLLDEYHHAGDWFKCSADRARSALHRATGPKRPSIP
jgi:Meiotically up-regulated gene 113